MMDYIKTISINLQLHKQSVSYNAITISLHIETASYNA